MIISKSKNAQITELTDEIYSLQTEHKQHERSANEYGGLQKTHEILLNEVRVLEGTLADYNLAMDKARVSNSQCGFRFQTTYQLEVRHRPQ